jgi:hypothetical protein
MRTTRNSQKLDSPDGDINKSSSIQSSLNDYSPDNSFVDEQIEVKLREIQTPIKTQSQTVYDDIDDVYDFNSAPIIFKTKSSQDLQLQKSPHSSDTSPSSKKFVGTRKIFTNSNSSVNTNSQIKRVSCDLMAKIL